MKKLLGLIFALWANVAVAGVPCTLPFNLQNNTLADANQVMANYNAIIACLVNAAAAGNNNDITALLGLTTPLSPTFGGSSRFTGLASGGSANAQTVSVSPAGFALVTGYQVSFNNSFIIPNGPVQLNVNGTGLINVMRHGNGASMVAFSGGEWLPGQRVTVEYDGPSGTWQWLGGSYNSFGTGSAAAPGPATINAQRGIATFTATTVAGNANATVSINDNTVTAASLCNAWIMAQPTAGAGATVASVTPGLGTLTIVLTNATATPTGSVTLPIGFNCFN
jgi:hypothetical protein